jgi:hypothetical protein
MPPEDAWPSPDTLINRLQLAELYGVTVPVIRGWERRGKGPRKVAQPPRDGFSEVLYRCADVREWLEKEVAKQKALEPKLQPEIPPRHPDVLCRTELVLNRMKEAERVQAEPAPTAVDHFSGSGWRALVEGDEPFASNIVTRSRPARYWGS